MTAVAEGICQTSEDGMVDMRSRVRAALEWRWFVLRGAIRSRLAAALGMEPSTTWQARTPAQRAAAYFGFLERPYARIVMDREIAAAMRALDYRSLRALEISGNQWATFGFGAYQGAAYPEYDVCAGVLEHEAFDVIIAEQVFEHVLWPYRGVRHVWQMLKPGGLFLVSTPFLIRRHDVPVDCSRWTELGLKHLLAEGGFRLEDIETHSWGNRACVRAGLQLPGYAVWLPWRHPLHHEPEFPVVVWAFARKALEPARMPGDDHTASRSGAPGPTSDRSA
jgi:SAM-dependent methyltransferase